MGSQTTEQAERQGIQRLLTPEQAAQRLQISVRSLHRLVREKRIECLDYGQKNRRFTEEMLLNPSPRKRICPREPGKVDFQGSRHLCSSTKKGGGNSRPLGTDFRALREEMDSWQ